MSAYDDFSSSMLRGKPSGPSVHLKSAPVLLPTPTFSIVIPALNNADVLPNLIQQLEKALRGQYFEVVFVDDGSTDGTWREIEIATRRHRNWQAIRLTREFGYQAALSAGINAARGRAVITMNADGRHPPEYVPSMIDRWREGTKVVQMVRTDGPGTGIINKATARIFNRVFSIVSEMPITGTTSDFRLLDRSVVDIIIQADGQTPFMRGLIPWLGYRTIEINYTSKTPNGGDSKYAFIRMASQVVNGLKTSSTFPLRLATYTGFAFASFSFAFLCYMAYLGTFSPQMISGWALVVGLIALLGGIQLVCVGLIGEYVGRLFKSHLGRPEFVIADAIGSTHQSQIITTTNDSDSLQTTSLRRTESVRLITAHIGDAENTPTPNSLIESRIESRIEAMRSEEAAFAPLGT